MECPNCGGNQVLWLYDCFFCWDCDEAEEVERLSYNTHRE